MMLLCLLTNPGVDFFPWKMRERRKRRDMKFTRCSEGGSVLGKENTMCEDFEVRGCLEF